MAPGAVQPRALPLILCYTKGMACPRTLSFMFQWSSSDAGRWQDCAARAPDANTKPEGLLPWHQVTFGHDLVHGHREEEDGIAVVGP